MAAIKGTEALTETGTASTRRLLVEAPPRHGKSALCSIYLPAWFLASFPHKNIIQTSATQELATEFSWAARNIYREFSSWFPVPGARLLDDSKSKSAWKTEAGGGLRAVGAGGSIFGRGADLLIIDDYFGKIEDAFSEAERNHRHRWYHGTLRNRLSRQGTIIIIATRYHPDDLIGRLLREQDDGGDQWRRISFSALAGPEDPLGRQEGEELWPEFELDGETFGFGREHLEKIRDSYYASGYGWQWESLYQNNPPTSIDSEFDPAWLGDHLIYERPPSRKDVRYRILALDPSLGKSDKSDYSAFVDLQLAHDGTMYVEADLDRRNPWTIVEDGIRLCQATNPDVFVIEGNAYQEILAPIFEEFSKRRGLMLPLWVIHNHENKVVRIRAGLTPYLARGEFRFRRSAGTSLLLEQLRGFPGHGFDDGPDALEMALSMVRKLFFQEVDIRGDNEVAINRIR